MRALAIRQPFAWAICAGLKKTENRTWSTDYRGTIAIHASTSPAEVREMKRETGSEFATPVNFTFGAIIGFAEIVDVASFGPQHENDPFACGPFCWTMGNGRLLREPIPIKGKLNLFNLPRAVSDRLQRSETYIEEFAGGSAARALADAMDFEPDPVQGYIELFDEFCATGLHAEALPTAGERLIELSPTEATGYLIRGHRITPNRTLAERAKDLRRAVELDPSDALAWGVLARVLNDQEKHGEALAAVNEAIRLRSNISDSFDHQATAYIGLDRFQEAIESSDQAIRLDSEVAHFWGRRALAKRLAGDFEGAIGDLDQAIALEPDEEAWRELRTSFAAAAREEQGGE